VLLARGVQPNVIEDMTSDQIDFWLDVCAVITQAEKDAQSN